MSAVEFPSATAFELGVREFRFAWTKKVFIHEGMSSLICTDLSGLRFNSFFCLCHLYLRPTRLQEAKGGNDNLETLMLIEMIFSGVWPSALPDTAKKPFINVWLFGSAHFFFLFPPPPASSMLVKDFKFLRFKYINALIFFPASSPCFCSVDNVRRFYSHFRYQLFQDLPGRPRRGAVLLYNVVKKHAIFYRLQNPDTRRLLTSTQPFFRNRILISSFLVWSCSSNSLRFFSTICCCCSCWVILSHAPAAKFEFRSRFCWRIADKRWYSFLVTISIYPCLKRLDSEWLQVVWHSVGQRVYLPATLAVQRISLLI